MSKLKEEFAIARTRSPARETRALPNIFSHFRSQRDGGFGWQEPLFVTCNSDRACSAVARGLACPKCFPPAAQRRRKQRFRSRMQNLSVSKIHYQQTIVVAL